jgi:hypothetical protein
VSSDETSRPDGERLGPGYYVNISVPTLNVREIGGPATLAQAFELFLFMAKQLRVLAPLTVTSRRSPIRGRRHRCQSAGAAAPSRFRHACAPARPHGAAPLPRRDLDRSLVGLHASGAQGAFGACTG